MIARILLTRPHFLLGGALLFAVGAAAADHVGVADYLLGQTMVSAIQVTAHLVNEYADAAADEAVHHRTWFSGGSGVIAAGAASRSTALRMAIGSTVIASIAIGLVVLRSPAAGAIGVVALAIAWSYSIEPFRLLDTGLGEAATTLVVAAGVPLTGALASGGPVTSELWWAIGVITPIHLGMMLVFELPDVESDRLAGKRVLAVRLGSRRTRRLVALAFMAGFGILVTAIAGGDLPDRSAWAAAAGVPAVVTLVAAARASWSRATAAAVATLVVAALGTAPGI